MSKLLRAKCANCGDVSDIPANYTPCKKCGKPLDISGDAVIQIYRMGSPIGMAVGYGIYINEHPCGHIGNKESIRIPLPYGTYTLRFTCGLTRKCEGVTITLSEEKRHAFVKAHIKMGFWSNKVVAEECSASEMPPLE